MNAKTKRTIENTFAAVAFAEVGEHETAIQMAKVTSRPRRLLDNLMQWWDTSMAAITFAEVGELEEARRLMSRKEDQPEKKDTLAGFLEKVGLENTRVRYCVVALEG